MSFTMDTTAKSSRTPLPRGFVNAIVGDFYVQEVDDKFKEGQKKTELVLTFITTHKTKNKEGVEINAAGNLFCTAAWGTSEKPSNIRKFILNWFGPLTDDQLKRFDFEKLIGKRCSIMVSHYTKKTGGIGDKIELATDVRPDLPQIDAVPADFIRKADRPPREGAPRPANSAASAPKTESRNEDYDLPF